MELLYENNSILYSAILLYKSITILSSYVQIKTKENAMPDTKTIWIGGEVQL